MFSFDVIRLHLKFPIIHSIRFSSILSHGNTVPLDLLSNKITLRDISMNTENNKKLKKPKAWKHSQPITPAQLKQMRDEFWDTAPHYGGQKGMFTTV